MQDYSKRAAAADSCCGLISIPEAQPDDPTQPTEQLIIQIWPGSTKQLMWVGVLAMGHLKQECVDFAQCGDVTPAELNCIGSRASRGVPSPALDPAARLVTLGLATSL